MADPRELKSGKWQARIYVNGQYKSLGTFKTKTEAKKATRQAEAKLDKGESLEDRSTTFGEVAERYISWHTTRVKPATSKNARESLRIHAKVLYHMKLSSIRRDDIDKWMASLKLAPGTKRRILNNARAVFNFAIHDLDLISKNPAHRVSIPDPDENAAKKVKRYTLGEINSMLDELGRYQSETTVTYRPHRAAVYLIAHTGLRVSEALALTWGDLKDGQVRVNKQLPRSGDRSIPTTPKTKASYRTIALTKDVIYELEVYKGIQEKLIASGALPDNRHDAIFMTASGSFISASGLRHAVRKSCERSGVEYRGIHSFRHSHAVHLLEADATIKYVSTRLGHAEISTTSDIYLSITQKIEDAELQKYESYRSGLAQNWHDTKKEVSNSQE